MIFLSELTAAGVGPCGDCFLGYNIWILEPQGNVVDFEVDAEDLLIIEDHFRIAGPWIKTQFGIVPNTPERYRESLLYTEERWELWKRNLRVLADRSSDEIGASVTRILAEMD